MRLRALLRLTHLWAGLALCLLLVVLGVTGSALVYKEAYWRTVYPELRESPEAGPADAWPTPSHADGIAAAVDRFGAELRSVKLPEPGVGAYHLYLQDGEAFLSLGGHEVIDRWSAGERAMGFLFELHAHLMAGETGEKVGGIVALLGVFMVVTGVILWWPARRRFRWRTLLPTGGGRHQILPGHRDLGLLATPVLLILLVTGAGIVFYGAAGTALNALLPGGDPIPADAPVIATERPLPPADATMLARVDEELPDARLVFYYPPADGSGVHGFRLKRPCELHPNGRSYLYLDGAGDVLRRVDACAQPAGQKVLHAVYPLHAAKAGTPGEAPSNLYKAVVFLGGLVLTLVSATGAAAYIAQLAGERRRRAPDGRDGAPAQTAMV